MINNKQTFQELYNNNTLIQLAKMFNVSIPTIYRKAKVAGIKMKGRGNSKASGRPKKTVLGF